MRAKSTATSDFRFSGRVHRLKNAKTPRKLFFDVFFTVGMSDEELVSTENQDVVRPQPLGDEAYGSEPSVEIDRLRMILEQRKKEKEDRKVYVCGL
jgi:hypothetical protein